MGACVARSFGDADCNGQQCVARYDTCRIVGALSTHVPSDATFPCSQDSKQSFTTSDFLRWLRRVYHRHDLDARLGVAQIEKEGPDLVLDPSYLTSMVAAFVDRRSFSFDSRPKLILGATIPKNSSQASNRIRIVPDRIRIQPPRRFDTESDSHPAEFSRQATDRFSRPRRPTVKTAVTVSS